MGGGVWLGKASLAQFPALFPALVDAGRNGSSDLRFEIMLLISSLVMTDLQVSTINLLTEMGNCLFLKTTA